jgi:hypothetical protein
VRLAAVVTPPAPERTELDSPDPTGTARPLDTTPPGWTGADRALLPVRDDPFDVGIRLGERDTLDPELPDPDDELEPPLLEPELVEPELPPELDPDDPDDPELDPDELPRGTACAPARLGAASANETARLSARRVDLAMAVLPRSLQGPLRTVQLQLYCQSSVP